MTRVAVLIQIFFPAILVPCLCVAGIKHAHNGRGNFGYLGRGVEPRLGINVHRILQIEKHIERIRERIKEAKHVDVEQFINEMDARVTALEESPCGDHEFQCGGDDSHECVSDLFVCDGHLDCHNGHDEDDDVCSIAPVKAGNSFIGVLHWTGCVPWEDYVQSFEIISSKRLKAFPSRVEVKTIIHADVVTEELEKMHFVYNLDGWYNFATREMNLYIRKGQEFLYNLYLSCKFNRGDDERAHCQVPFEGSDHTCAHGDIVLVQHDGHDDDDGDDDDDGRHGYYGHDQEEKNNDEKNHDKNRDKDDDHDKHD